MSREALARPLRPVSDPLPPLSVLYDGNCALCRWAIGKLRQWDREGLLRLRPYQSTREQPILADLVRGRSLAGALHVVDGAGRVAAAGDAVLAIVALLPAGRSVAAFVAAVPLSYAVLHAAYRLLERIRGPLASTFALDGPHLHERNPAFDPPRG